MQIGIIVKVMNFHSLIRVDAARRKADQYILFEKEVFEIMDMMVNNRNFILDKRLWNMDETGPPLNIYFGSDYGFCGSINFQINNALKEDVGGEKVIIGKKIHTDNPGVLLKLEREEFSSRYPEIRRLIENSIIGHRNSEINLIYHHFNNTSSIEMKKKRIFPIDIAGNGRGKYKEDYYVEGDPNKIFLNLITSYINYEVKAASVNCFASENIIRQNSTRESLKRIDELELENRIHERKLRLAKEFSEVIENYIKKKVRGDMK